MGCRSAVVDGCGRNIRPFLSRCGAMAGGGAKPSSPEGNGSRHDILHPAELLLRGWNLGHVMDRLDLDQYCVGYPREEKTAGATNVPGGSCCVEGGRSDHVEHPASARPETSTTSRTVLLRLAASSAGRSLVELERTARQIFPH